MALSYLAFLQGMLLFQELMIWFTEIKKKESFRIKKELTVVKSPLMHLEIILNSKIRDVTNAEKELATFRTHEKISVWILFRERSSYAHSERENEFLFFSYYGDFRNLVLVLFCATFL